MKQLAIAVVVLSFLGCNSGEKKTPAKKEAPTKADIPADEPVRVKLTETQVAGVFDAWLAAQNGGDFLAYSNLYAKKFNGVKRVGSKSTRYSRKTWLADRKRMFKKDMAVEASDRKFSLSFSSGQVRFKQRWSSGTYEDVGPKRVLVVLEDGALKIAQEEMLASDVVRKVSDQPLYFVHDTRMALHDAPVPTKHGAPREIEDDGVVATIASVATADIDPAIVAKWQGKSVVVDGECKAKVTGFELLSRVVPHFGTEHGWDCFDGAETIPGCIKPSPAQRASEAFDEGDATLVAVLSDCDGSYARAASAAKMTSGDIVGDKALKAQATKAFGKLKAVRDQMADGDEWWVGHTKAAAFRHPQSGKTLVSVHAEVGEGCGDFEASVWQVWEVRGSKLKPLGTGDAPLEIIETLDVNGDGMLEFLVKGDVFGTELALVDAKTLVSSVGFGYVYNDSPC